jgi:prephenate dehydratase
VRVAYLGPAGTYNEEALLAAAAGAPFDPMPKATVFEAVSAVEHGEAEVALVPFENSIEGSVRSTLDALAFDTERVRIVGEVDLTIRHNLIARRDLPLDEIEVVLSHPQANAQCARFVRQELPKAEVRAVTSTAEAVRLLADSDPERPWAALGSEAAARAYGCRILRAGVEDAADNVTRFVWLSLSEAPESSRGTWRTSLVFSELGDDHPGALVDALTEFAVRGVNLTRIESRPLRRGLGRYLFFIDLEGSLTDRAVRESVDALRVKAESVRVLGSYPVAGPAPL